MAKKLMVIAVGVIVVVAGATAAFAHSTSPSSHEVAGGFSLVAACDPAPSWSYSFGKNSNGQVTTVEISAIDVSCAGGSMQISLAGPLGWAVGSPTLISDCSATCSVLVPFGTDLLFPSEVNAAHALIAGP